MCVYTSEYTFSLYILTNSHFTSIVRKTDIKSHKNF